MSGAARPAIYSIAAHRGFADALVAGLVPRYREDGFGLARLTLILPSARAMRTVTEAFVRASTDGGRAGLLLPRMVAIGDLDIDETLGPLLDPIGAGAGIPPAADPVLRLLRVAEHLRAELGSQAPGEAGLLRQARDIVRTIDRMGVEGVAPERLLGIDMLEDLAGHWQAALRTFARVQARWRSECTASGWIDPPERRNRLLEHAARRWQAEPPPYPVVAAGVTSASPAIAGLLRTIAALPRGAVILPDLDLALETGVWDALGQAGAPREPGGPVFGRGDAVTHPQYHLKLLLNRMGVARDEVQPWHRSGAAAAPPARSRAISSLFLPPEASVAWATMAPERRRLGGVRLMESAHPEEEAQAVAVLVREALEVPERRVAVVSPDRALAGRIVAHLARWGIEADDSAGRPLSQTVAGRLLLQLAELRAARAAPVELLAVLGHPLVRADEHRAVWLDRVREADLALRGPRAGIGAEAIGQAFAARHKASPALGPWWAEEALPLLAPLILDDAPLPLGEALALLATTAEALAGQAVWAKPDGRALAAFVEQWREAARDRDRPVPAAELPVLLREAMEAVAVRPPYGGHPRLAIYGLIEARMTRADLVICAGLTEGSWPGVPAPDPLLAQPVLRQLGIPGAEFRIGLAAHDLASALGAPEVVLSHARRDADGPAIPSRFLLRIRAMLGEAVEEETRAVRLACALDWAPPAPPYPRPQPMPTAEQRRVPIAVTALDRLRSDPYQFYASSILRLRRLDPLDADPTPAWRGTVIHKILETWHEAGAPPGQLLAMAERQLAQVSAHPFMRALWLPRLAAALAWIEREQVRLAAEGRRVLAWECDGQIDVRGVRIHGRADRIDRKADGTLAVVDYKTGKPPGGKLVERGFALQLGLVGLIAAQGGFRDVAGEPTAFEYWSLSRRRNDDGFGFMEEPVREGQKRSGLPRDAFLDQTAFFLNDAIDRWILGEQPFTALLNPDLPGYTDFDQLMRLDEWQGRGTRRERAG